MTQNVLISEAQYQQIIKHALLAMSGNNCQPWKFHRISQNIILIFHEAHLGKHTLNPNNFASIIAFGTLVEAFQVGAATCDLIAKHELLDSFGGVSFNPWLKITLAPKTQNSLPAPQNESFFKRSVIRDAYSKQIIPASIIKLCLSSDNDLTAIKTSFSSSLSKEFIELACSTEQRWWSHQPMVRDILKWIRWTNSEYTKKLDGMHYAELGCPTAAIPFLWLLTKAKFILYATKKIVAKNAANQLRANLNNSGGFICFASKSASPQKFFSVGRVAMRTALHLTESGIVYQPITLLPFALNQAAMGFNIPEITLSTEKIFQAQSIVRRQFGLNNDEVALWIFRIGYPQKSNLVKRSLRRTQI